MAITQIARPEETRFAASHTCANAGSTQDLPALAGQASGAPHSPVSVSPVIAEVFTSLQPGALSKNIMLINNTFQQVNVPISKNIIHFMIMVLVDNSIKYSGDGRVDVSCEKDKNCLSVQVKDDGIGMDSWQIDQIMQPAAPGIPVKSREAGQGKGLKQVNELLQQLNGSMVINSIPGKGTTVKLDIPVAA